MIIKVRSLSFDDELLALVFCLLARTDDAIIFEFFNGQTVVTVVSSNLLLASSSLASRHQL
jgi:hypothetical protein